MINLTLYKCKLFKIDTNKFLILTFKLLNNWFKTKWNKILILSKIKKKNFLWILV